MVSYRDFLGLTMTIDWPDWKEDLSPSLPLKSSGYNLYNLVYKRKTITFTETICFFCASVVLFHSARVILLNETLLTGPRKIMSDNYLAFCKNRERKESKKETKEDQRKVQEEEWQL